MQPTVLAWATRKNDMKILFLTSTLPRFPKDLQAPFVFEQAKAWKQRRPEDEIVILAPHDAASARKETVDGIEIQRFQYFAPARFQAVAYPAILPNIKRNPLILGQLPFFLWSEYATARRIVKARNIDLVYAHWVMPQGVVARWIRKTTGVPYFVQNHSSDLAVFGKLGAVGRSVARSVLRGAHGFFCVNERQKQAALDFFPFEERRDIANRTTVLPMGVGMDVEQVGSSVTPVAAGGFAQDFGMISRLSRKKGVDHFIAAVERLAEDGLFFPVAIAGDGEDRQALSALPRTAKIRFVGILAETEKLNFFDGCRFMAFPSVATGGDVEGLPVAVLEALCCGKLIVAGRDTNIEMLPEWPEIQQAVELLDDPRDIDAFAAALRRLLALEPYAIYARVERLRGVMARYRWNRLIDEYLARIDQDGLAAARCGRGP
jgi:glycosyltransferase involved in cell wall biosynthesis